MPVRRSSIDERITTTSGHIDRWVKDRPLCSLVKPPDMLIYPHLTWLGFRGAVTGNVRRFANAKAAKALAAFIGVTPRQRISASSLKGRTMMSRSGHAQLRRAFYMPGLVARRHNPVLKAFGDRLTETGLAPTAVVGALMRRLTHLIYGMINPGKLFDPLIATPRLGLQDGI